MFFFLINWWRADIKTQLVSKVYLRNFSYQSQLSYFWDDNNPNLSSQPHQFVVVLPRGARADEINGKIGQDGRDIYTYNPFI